MDVSGARHFGVADYVVFSIMLLFSAAIGIFVAFTGGRQRTADEVLLGDRRMNPVPVALSIMVSFISAITVIGVPAEIYVFDTMYSWTLVATIIGNTLLCVFFLPVYFRLRMTSIYEASLGELSEQKTKTNRNETKTKQTPI